MTTLIEPPALEAAPADLPGSQWGRPAPLGTDLPRYSLRRPDEYSILLGRAHYRHQLRIPFEEHVLLKSPPRKGKSRLLARVIWRYPGSVVSTTTKHDIWKATHHRRMELGSVDVLNPQGIGGARVPSTVAWDVVAGCEHPATAIRRADAFAFAASTKGMDGDGGFWSGKASDVLRGLFFAAAFARTRGYNYGLANATRWAVSDASREAEEILQDAGANEWSAQIAELRSEAAKTAATVRMVLSRALSFMADPALAAAVTPRPGDPGINIESWVRHTNTLYMISSGQGDNAPLAPLFAAMASEIHYQAGLVGSWYPRGSLPHPMLFALDEVTQICPVPLPEWVADSGGKGQQLIIVAHGDAQLRNRWGANGMQIIKDCCSTYIALPGVKDDDTLDALSKISGTVAMREHQSDSHSQHPVMTPAMIRQLPVGFGLAIRDNLSPVVFKVGSIHSDRLVRQARKIAAATRPVPPSPPAEAKPDVPLPGPGEGSQA